MNWAFISKMGRLRIFGVSYVLVLVLLAYFNGVEYYNQQVKNARDSADRTTEETRERIEKMEHMPEEARQKTIVAVERLLQLPERMDYVRIEPQLAWLVVWTLVLMLASAVYSIWCPNEVQEVTEVGWGQANKPMIHYWAFTWKNLYVRATCLLLYAVGGLGAGWIVASKLWLALSYAFREVSA